MKTQTLLRNICMILYFLSMHKFWGINKSEVVESHNEVNSLGNLVNLLLWNGVGLTGSRPWNFLISHLGFESAILCKTINDVVEC